MPQLVHLPPGVVSLAAAVETIELAESVGLVLDEAQRFVVNAACGERADGSWAASEVADIEPRQNGKGDTKIARQLAGLFLFGEALQIHTAHEFPTANEMFLRLVSLIEGSDDLRRRVARVRYANGEQGVELLNGNRLKYRARTGGSGRGFAGVSVLYYDEALFLTDAHMGASRPALITNPNAQVWYASSPGLATSAVMWRLRKRALRQDGSRLAYIEHTAEDVSLDTNGRVRSRRPDPDDRGAWALANPTLGDRITVEAVESERASMSTETFLRERLGVWDPELGQDNTGPWPAEVWLAALDVNAAPEGRLAVGVACTPGQSWSSIAVAGGGRVELVEHRPSATWLVDRLVELRDRNSDLRDASVAVDSSGPAGFVIRALETAGFAVVKVGAQLMGQACAYMSTSVTEGQVRVRPHDDLTAAVGGAQTLPKDDVWVWSRKDDSTDISPLEAVTLAHWASVHAVDDLRIW